MLEWKDEIKDRLARLKLDPTREAEIAEELSQHLEDRYAESLASGATPEEASRAALAELSASEIFERELRYVERQIKQGPFIPGTSRRMNMVADLLQDLRYGARMLMKQPGLHIDRCADAGAGHRREYSDFQCSQRGAPAPFTLCATGADRRHLGWPWPTGFDAGRRLPRNFQMWREQSRSFSDLALARGLNYRLTETQEAGHRSGGGSDAKPLCLARSLRAARSPAGGWRRDLRGQAGGVEL